MSAIHLIRRFFGSLSSASLDPAEFAFVRESLNTGEIDLWQKMSKADQRHAFGVAQRTVEILGTKATRPVIAAALLHDVGKIESGLGTFGRVAATLAGQQASGSQVDSWSKESGWLGRAGRYLQHHSIGRDMLQRAGSDYITSQWAYEHELLHTQWTLDPVITEALWRADNGKGKSGTG